MEQFTSDALKHSPPSNLSFQTDKFTKISDRLSIPDTIHEQAELSGESTKMEASGDLTKIFNDERENNLLVVCNESSDNSKINTIDYSLIKRCERRLLENSCSDNEKTIDFENKSAVNNKLLEVPSRLVFNNDTISTPPSALRKEISLLRSELAAAEEFHDFEIQVLKEEKLHGEIHPQDYLQVVKKNAELIELYTSLKNEYDEYRKEQEKMRNELHSKTADCLESLCSQIEASDSSLNFSNTSLISFNAGIRSSTMLENISEVEVTVMHDATVLTSDPLSMTLDGTFKTPLQTPLKSTNKLVPQQVTWPSKISDMNEVNEIIDKSQCTVPRDSKYNIQLLNLEASLDDKLKKVDSLEQRLFKVEDISNAIQSDCERTKEILLKKSEQLDELTQKLFTETISLNPALRDSLIDVPGPKLLLVFIETIMEKCKNIQDELIAKHNCEKTEWEAQRKIELTAIENLKNQIKSLNEQLSSGESKIADLEDYKLNLEKKLTDAENAILTREVEMRILQTSVRDAREDFASSAEALLKLESQLSVLQAEKKMVENQCHELQETIRCLTCQLEEKDKLLLELELAKSTAKNIQKENEALKQIVENSQETIAHLKMESSHKNELLQEIEWLRNKEASRFNVLFQGLEDLKKTIGDTAADPSSENTALAFLTEKLDECPDPQLLSAVEAVLEYTKMDFELKRKSDLAAVENLRHEIKIANEKNVEFETELSGVRAENIEFKKLCEDLKVNLREAESAISLRDEEIMGLEKEEKVLKKLKEDLALLEDIETNDSLADRIRKLITDVPEQQRDKETGETRILSTCVEILSKTCIGVQNEFIKKIECKKLEWESQKTADMDMIDSLQVRLKTLSEECGKQEVEMSRMTVVNEDLKKLQDDLIKKMAEAESIISTQKEKIRSLESQEVTLKQTEDELALANETIFSLKSQMTSIEAAKTEMETQCHELQETNAELKRLLNSSENLRSALDSVQSALENVRRENEELWEINKQSSEVIDRLKAEACEQNAEELLQEIDSLRRKEESRFRVLFEILEDGKRKLKERELWDFAENSALSLVSDELTKSLDSQTLLAVDAIADFIKIEFDGRRKKDVTHMEYLENQIKSLTEKNSEHEVKLNEIINENIEFKKLCENLKIQLHESENRLSLREEEISFLKKEGDVVKEMKDALALADETSFKLNCQLSLIEEEKKQIENQYKELEDTLRCLKCQLEEKDKLLLELEMAKSIAKNIQKENEALKQIVENSQETIAHLKMESSHKNELLQEIEWLRNKEASRFNVLFQGLEDLKKTIGDTAADPSSENTALAFLTEKLDECPDPQLLSAVEAVLEYTKMDFELKRKSDLAAVENLRHEIKIANEKNVEFETELSGVRAENIEFKKLCEDLKVSLREAESAVSLRDEEIMGLKMEEKVLKKLKEDLALLEDIETNDSLADRIRRLITDLPEQQRDKETGETRIVSVCVEILSKTCIGVQNEFIKKIECKKLEWESQKTADMDMIDSLQVRLKTLSEECGKQEVEMSRMTVENEDLKKLQDDLIKKMAEAESIISTQKEEIRNLESHAVTLKQTEDDLALANETISSLKSQVFSKESEKAEIELRCRKIEENAGNLEEEIQTKEMIIKELDEMKEKKEKEINELRRQIRESDDVILELNRGLESAKEEQRMSELKIKDLHHDMESLKKEKENLTDFAEKLEKLQKTNRNLIDVLSDIGSHLDLPEDTITKLSSGNLENKNMFREKINNLVKTHAEEIRAENKNLKLNNRNLKEKVQQLTKILSDTANVEMKEELSQPNAMNLRSRSNRNIDLFVRRLDKIEDMNHNLTELLTEILTLTEYPDLEKLNLAGAKNFSVISKKVVSHMKSFASRLKELKEENAQLDEECDMYSNIIKNLKKEASANEEKTKAMHTDMLRMKEEKAFWEKEREELLTKISRLEGEYHQLKSASRTEGPPPSWNGMSESKKVNDLKRAILIREQKLLELQDLEAQASSYKSQIDYLKGALEREKKKVTEEKDKNKKLQNELKEASKNRKSETRKEDQNEILEELRMRGSLSGGVVQEFVDKEKMRKLSKDIGILKELCRARYVEIKRLEALNASLRNKTPKNSNQMDSPIRSRGYITRSKNGVRDTWKTENSGKENSPMHAEHLY